MEENNNGINNNESNEKVRMNNSEAKYDIYTGKLLKNKNNPDPLIDFLIGFFASGGIYFIEIILISTKLSEGVKINLSLALLVGTVIGSIMLFRRNHKIMGGTIFILVCLPILGILALLGACIMMFQGMR